MKTLTTLFTAGLLAATCGATLAPHAAQAKSHAQPDSCDAKRSIAISGSATVIAQPDLAIVTFTINKRANALAAALGALKGDSLRLRDALQRAGVASTDINTDHFSILPFDYEPSQARASDYNGENKPAQERIYAVNSRIDVTVREIKRLSEFVDLGIASGAEGIAGLQMLDSKLRAHRDEARVLAAKAAREKATLLATASGAKLGCLIKIEEVSRWWWNDSGNVRGQNTVQAAADPGADGQPAYAGAINAQAEVQLVYALE